MQFKEEKFMKHVTTMTDLFERLNDLKIVFRYGQKLIPIIQSLIDFMKETVPLLEDINTSIADSTSKIPKAKDQINNVTSATELATTEILDIIDSISLDMENIEKSVKDFQSKEEERIKIWDRLKEIFSSNSEAAELMLQFEGLNQYNPVVPEIIETFKKIKNGVYSITLSLQVQDITSQQLAAVNHLIESVRTRLSSLIIHLDETEIKDFNEMKIDVPEGSTFDPDAIYTKSSEKQDTADVLVNNINSKATQDEIDKLFS